MVRIVYDLSFNNAYIIKYTYSMPKLVISGSKFTDGNKKRYDATVHLQ